MTVRTDRNQTFFDGVLVDEEIVEVDITEEVNEITLRDRAALALEANRTYLAIPSPTAADIRLQVERLTRQNQALIRLVVSVLDDVD